MLIKRQAIACARNALLTLKVLYLLLKVFYLRLKLGYFVLKKLLVASFVRLAHRPPSDASR